MIDLLGKTVSYSEYRNYAIAHTEKEEPKFDAAAYGCQYPDLTYEVDDSEKNYKNCLDLYLPEKRHGKVPLLIYIHGGAFTLGTKRCSTRPLIMRDYGYAVAMVEYTKATEKPFPTQIRQVKQAIAFLRENAAKYGYEENQIAAYGESAGGNLAALAGVTGNRVRFGLSADRDYSLQAVVTDFAPINFASTNEELRQIGIEVPDSPLSAQYYSSLYLGGFMQEFPELVPPTNPETYLTSKCPPFFIQHGMKHALPYLQAEKFADKLRKKIGDGNVELVLLPDVGGGDDPNYFTKENTQRKVDFLNRIFKKEK